MSDVALGHQCRSLASDLGFLGVAGHRPSRGEIAQDQIGRHDTDDLFMVSVAKLVFDLVLSATLFRCSGGHTSPAIDASVDETIHIRAMPSGSPRDLMLPTPLILDTLRSLVRPPSIKVSAEINLAG